MPEYIYKIDLPPFTNLVRQPRTDSEGIKFPINLEVPRHIRRYSVASCLYRNYYKINDFYLQNIYVNYKSNCSSEIIVANDHYIRKDTDPCFWAICWSHTGSTTVDYWNAEDITDYTRNQESSYNDVTPMQLWNLVCTTESPPAKTYNLINNQAYLIKTSQPYRITGAENTYFVEVRPRTYMFTWDEVVEKFQSYIISD